MQTTVYFFIESVDSIDLIHNLFLVYCIGAILEVVFRLLLLGFLLFRLLISRVGIVHILLQSVCFSWLSQSTLVSSISTFLVLFLSNFSVFVQSRIVIAIIGFLCSEVYLFGLFM